MGQPVDGPKDATNAIVDFIPLIGLNPSEFDLLKAAGASQTATLPHRQDSRTPTES